MSEPRRRIVRPTDPASNSRRQRQLQRLRGRLEHERAALTRWQRRLRRAFGKVERLHRQIDSLERRRSRLEGGH